MTTLTVFKDVGLRGANPAYDAIGLSSCDKGADDNRRTLYRWQSVGLEDIAQCHEIDAAIVAGFRAALDHVVAGRSRQINLVKTAFIEAASFRINYASA